MISSWDEIINLFFFKVQKSSKFFNYYNVTEEESMEIANKLAVGFLLESIVKITSICTPDVNFNDYDFELRKFNFVLTNAEADLLARFMLEMYFEKDKAKLTVATNVLSSQDLKYVFSGWHERNSFMEMFNNLQRENISLARKYVSRDRLTGTRKFPVYDL